MRFSSGEISCIRRNFEKKGIGGEEQRGHNIRSWRFSFFKEIEGQKCILWIFSYERMGKETDITCTVDIEQIEKKKLTRNGPNELLAFIMIMTLSYVCFALAANTHNIWNDNVIRLLHIPYPHITLNFMPQCFVCGVISVYIMGSMQYDMLSVGKVSFFHSLDSTNPKTSKEEDKTLSL